MRAYILLIAAVFALTLEASSQGRKCVGNSHCSACTTCSGCKYCNEGGGKCGVCGGLSAARKYSSGSKTNQNYDVSWINI